MKLGNIISGLKTRRNNALDSGVLKQQRCAPFPEELFYKLKDLNLNGMPMGFTLMASELCNGKCYERSTELSFAFDDCTQYYADIHSLKKNSITKSAEAKQNLFSDEHAFLENNGMVYDTSNGLVFDKDLYWRIEKPNVHLTYTKSQCTERLRLLGIFSQQPEDYKLLLLLAVQCYKKILKDPQYLSTKVNQKFLQSEFTKFLKEVDYDGNMRAINEDITCTQKDPAAIDEKYGIVRDRLNGAVISRNGVPNPNYRPLSTWQAEKE